MKSFFYVARDSSGDKVTGTLEAADKQAALAKLKQLGRFPISLTEDETPRPSYPLAHQESSIAHQEITTSKKGTKMSGRMPIRKILFSFRGRILRKTYWFSQLGLLVGLVVVAASCSSIHVAKGWERAADSIASICSLFFMSIFLWVMLATQAKRWHDRGKSGWMYLIIFIPVVGDIYALVELGFLRGTVGPNEYGEDPLQTAV